MPIGTRRGLTLIELLIGIVLGSFLGTIMVGLGLAAERSTRHTREAGQLARNLDTVLDFLESELADAGTDPSGADLLRLGADSLTWRATRGVGLACLVGSSEVRVLQGRWGGARLPQPGRDSLLLYAGADSLQTDSLVWLALPILGVSSSSCAGAPALRLQTSLDTTLTPLGRLPALVPVRVFEIMQVRLYSSLGSWWFGGRSVTAGEVIQPLAGPFLAGGLRFSYLDSAAQPTPSSGMVRSIAVVVRGSAAGRTDSAAAHWAPANLLP